MSRRKPGSKERPKNNYFLLTDSAEILADHSRPPDHFTNEVVSWKDRFVMKGSEQTKLSNNYIFSLKSDILKVAKYF